LKEKKGHTRHHYVLVHRALRDVYLDDPLRFVLAMGRDDHQRSGLLERIWQWVREQCDDEGPAGFAVHEVQICQVEAAGRPAVLLSLPRPRSMTEAYFVLALAPKVPAGHTPERDRPSKIRSDRPSALRRLRLQTPGFFTLERGRELDGREVSRLCGWTEDTHHNYGKGPEPKAAAFVLAVEGLVGGG